MCCWSQWRVVVGIGVAYYEGIDRASLLSTMDMLGIQRSKRRAVLMQVQILESEAKLLRNERD
ncbi:DUF1799 domain-containing protein [Comamonas flocculans]|uniref:DUF1799 domain-containing protein n=1 Tax=Comamonas flocculans TaxID=2597701 RepID=UPI0021050660|nr:DUF1799 domain-containing protein [Comamonas flocculans]